MLWRILRIILGALLGLVGLAVLAASVLALGWLVDSDDTITAPDPVELSTDGAALTMQEGMLTHYGPVVHLDIESNDPERGVFVGVGHAVDTRSYLADAPQGRLTGVSLPFELTVTDRDGERDGLPAPQSLDWWNQQASGDQHAQLSWELTDAPHELLILHTDGAPNVDVTATVGIQVEGIFWTMVLVGVAGLVLLIIGVALIVVRRKRRTTSGGDDAARSAASTADPDPPAAPVGAGRSGPAFPHPPPPQGSPPQGSPPSGPPGQPPSPARQPGPPPPGQPPSPARQPGPPPPGQPPPGPPPGPGPPSPGPPSPGPPSPGPAQPPTGGPR